MSAVVREPFVLLELAREHSLDATGLRAVALRASRLLGCDDVDSTRVATAVSELARLAAASGMVRVTFAVVPPVAATTPGAQSSLTATFAFAGAGAALTRDAQTAVARLMDSLHVGDDEVCAGRSLGHVPTTGELGRVRDSLLMDSSAEAGALLQSINDELVAALVELREREADLVQLNGELDETNRGVVALYAELEQRSAEVRAAQRVVFEELSDALRPQPPDVVGVELAVTYLPAQQNSPTGGDLYDWFVLPDGLLHITVVDVRGHGVEGTRDALHVTHTVRTLALDGRPISGLLAQSDALVRLVPHPVVATALVAQFDPSTGLLHLAGAGHPPALRVSRDGSTGYLEAPGRPIGYEDGGSRSVSVTSLDPGDIVLLYTDGIIEIRRDVIEGMERLSRVMSESRHLPLANVLATAVARCLDGLSLADDTLLLALRWPGAAAAPGPADPNPL